MDDVIKLQRAGIDNEVILHYVQDSNSSTDLDADEIQRLENVGVSSSVIVAMLDRAKELRDDPTKVHAVAPAAPFAAQQPGAVHASYNPDVDVVAPAEGHADISLFYEALSPYGSWTQDRETGWVWEPSDSVRDQEWRPYANDGHWTWTNHGWYWESTSPYGWATFHYGRWGYNSNHRWSWSPDNVWGPAWVDWRHSDDHIGWAPLPFGSRFEAGVGFTYRGRNEGFNFHIGMEEREFSFVPSNAFLNINLGSSFVPERRRHTVYNETKIINNTYIYNDNRIINNGVPVAVVSRQTNRQIEQVKVVDANIAAGQPIRGDRRKDNAIAAYRPKIEARASVEPPVIVERQKLAAIERKAGKAQKVEATAATREAVVTQRKDNAEAEKQSRQRLQEEKQKRANGKQAENKQNAEDKRNANQDAAKERKAEGVATREAQEKVREEAADARKAAATERDAKVKDNQAASRERKEDAVKEPKEKARDANESAAAARKANAEAEAKVRVDAAKERKEDAAEAREAKEKAREDSAKERKENAAEAKEAKEKARDDRKEKNGKDK